MIFSVAATWNVSRWGLVERDAIIDNESALARFLEKKQWIIDATEFAATPDRYIDLELLPVWLAGDFAGLADHSAYLWGYPARHNNGPRASAR